MTLDERRRCRRAKRNNQTIQPLKKHIERARRVVFTRCESIRNICQKMQHSSSTLVPSALSNHAVIYRWEAAVGNPWRSINLPRVQRQYLPRRSVFVQNTYVLNGSMARQLEVVASTFIASRKAATRTNIIVHIFIRFSG